MVKDNILPLRLGTRYSYSVVTGVSSHHNSKASKNKRQIGKNKENCFHSDAKIFGADNPKV